MPWIDIGNTRTHVSTANAAIRVLDNNLTEVFKITSAGAQSSGSVAGGAIADGAITASKLAAGAVTEVALDPAANNTLNARRIAHYTYSFAVNGGDHTVAIPMTGAALPNNAMVFNSFIRIKTPPVGPTNASIQLLGAGDIIASAAIAGEPWSVAEPELGVCVAATESTWLITTNGTTIPAVVSTVADFSVGIWELWLEYVVLGQP